MAWYADCVGRKRKANDAPCPRGHTEGRNKQSQCRVCRRERDRKKIARSQYPSWLERAHAGMRRRRQSGEQVASRAQLLALWTAQNGRCGLTGLLIVGNPQLDHRLSVSAGGAHTTENLHWVHPMANGAKNAHSELDFRAWLLAAADALRAKIALESLF